jgi:DNA polymerase-3 subunit delta'
MQQALQINHSVLARLGILQKKDRLAHAYLFVGPPNIGKGETALAVAKLMNCETSVGGMFCDACPSCLKITSGNHPDVHVIDNGYGESIKIEQIRALLGRDRLRTFMAEKKVFILKNIENLTPDAANAFLKTLEEPSRDSLLLLTTAVLENNLDTIKSRCHMVHFQPMSNAELVKGLMNDRKMDAARSRFLTYFSQGCLQTAKKLEDSHFTQRKNEVIDAFILNRPPEVLIKETLCDKERAKELSDILFSWMRDALLVKAGVDDQRLIHLDRIADLKRFQQKFTFEEIGSINKSIVNMCRLLADHLNIKIPLLIIGEQLWER